MGQSKNTKKELTAALYVRLSRDDNLEGDSYSIVNQKKTAYESSERERLY